MFIKHGDGKIVSIMSGEELSEEQKKVAKDSLKQIEKTDNSGKKDQGDK